MNKLTKKDEKILALGQNHDLGDNALVVTKDNAVEIGKALRGQYNIRIHLSDGVTLDAPKLEKCISVTLGKEALLKAEKLMYCENINVYSDALAYVPLVDEKNTAFWADNGIITYNKIELDTFEKRAADLDKELNQERKDEKEEAVIEASLLARDEKEIDRLSPSPEEWAAEDAHDYAVDASMYEERVRGPIFHQDPSSTLEYLKQEKCIKNLSDIQAYHSVIREYNKNTLILVNTQKIRKDINGEIHSRHVIATLKRDIAPTIRYPILERQDLLDNQKRDAANYAKDYVVEIKQGKYAGQQGTVLEVNKEKNSITVEWIGKINAEYKQKEVMELKRSGDGLHVYKPENIFLAEGEKILFTKSDRNLGLQNCNTGIVTTIKEDGFTVKIKDKEVEIDPKKYPYIEYGYALSAHRKPEQTADKVVFVADTNSLNSYNTFLNVANSAKTDLRILTNDIDKLTEQVQPKTRTAEQTADLTAGRG